MQEVFANRRIGAHDERQVSLWSGKAPGALDEPVPERIQGLKLPCRGSFGSSPQGCGSGKHLEFPRQVVGEHSAQGEGLVCRQASSSNDIETDLVFGQPKQGLLGAAPVVEQDHKLCGLALVGDNHLVLIAEMARLEEIELDGILGLAFDFPVVMMGTTIKL
jgi:hypothetical protein